MKTKQFFRISLILFAILISSCTSEDGLDGENGINGIDGVQGEPGQDGSDGEDGEDGIDGQDGNANVIASDWITSRHSTTQKTSSVFIVEDNRITEEVLSSSVIIAYGTTQSFGIYPLPDSFNSQIYTFNLLPGLISFQAFTNDSSSVIFNTFNAFRYVIILSNSTSGKSSKSSKSSILQELKKAGVDINNYQQVANHFGLED